MYCPSCGAELRAEDKFCRQCGTQIRLPNNAEFQPQTTARSRPDRAKSQWWAAALSIVLLVPILGYLGVLVKGRIWKPQGLEGFVPYNPSSLKAESTPVLRGTSLRIYQPGDHWTYTSSVQLTQPDGTTQTGTGRLNNGIYVSTLDGKPVLTERGKDEVYLADGHGMEYDSNTYFQQDSSRNYSEVAEDEGSANTLQKLVQVQETTPGDIAASPSFSYETTTTQGLTCQSDMKVTGKECTRFLPDGQPTDCWPVSTTYSNSAGHSSTCSGMYSPSLGQFVTSTSAAKQPDGTVITETSTLIAYYLR